MYTRPTTKIAAAPCQGPREPPYPATTSGSRARLAASTRPRPRRYASGARHSAPATAPTPWAVVSSAVVCATAREPPWVRCRAITGTSAMNGEAKNATTAIAQIAAQQDGSPRAARRPDHNEAIRPSDRPAGGARRTNASATTTARNDTAFATNATGYPNAATVAPARAGPTMRPRLNWAEFRETAARNSDCGTRSGRIACWNGPISADAAPCSVTSSTSAAGLSWPAATRTASRTALSAAARFPMISTGRRGSRSASAPPTGDSSPIGRNAPAATSTAQVAWPVSVMTSAPTATVCIQDPTVDMRPAAQSNVNAL
jgi:hypothetical protein